MRVLLRVAAGTAADRIARTARRKGAISAALPQRLALVLFGALLLLAGCASLGPQLPMSSADEAASEELSFAVRTLGADGQFQLLSSREVARRLRSRLGDRPLSILALSGGGADGAFGAGALAGAARPEFTVVTGVSAGALVAPFAFLGPSRDADMTQLFTTGVTHDLFRRRGLAAIFGSSIYSDEALRQLIDRYVDRAMVNAIAAQAAKGRLLLVATTDLSTGEPVIWDLGSIALHGGRNAKRLLQSILLASASVPGMLPPVVVRFRSRGRMRAETHVDGGVTLPFFIAPAPGDLPRSTLAGAQPTVVRVIIDGPLRNSPRPTLDNALSVFRRSLSAGLTRVVRTQLERTEEALRERGITLDYAAIPASFPLHDSFDFSPEAQRSLFEYAENCAAAGRLWIGMRPGAPAGASELLPATASRMCPADDVFFAQLAALRD